MYGETITKDLAHVNISSGCTHEVDSHTLGEDADVDDGSWSAEVYFTNPNYQAKKTVFLLFINRASSQSQ